MLFWLALLNYATVCMNTSVFVLLAAVHFRFLEPGRWAENFKWTAGIFIWPLAIEFITSWYLCVVDGRVWSIVFLMLGWATNIACWWYQIQLSEEYDTDADKQDALVKWSIARAVLWVIRLVGLYVWIILNN